MKWPISLLYSGNCLLLIVFVIGCIFPDSADSLVIYRRKQKPKLICHEEPGSFSSASAQIDETPQFRSSAEYFGDSAGLEKNKEKSMEKKLREKRDESRKNKFGAEVLSDVEPAINLVVCFLILNKFKFKANSSVPGEVEINSDTFEIVGEQLTDEDRTLIRSKLVETCRALNLN